MTDPFRQFFLDTIEGIIEEEPNDENLHKLLRTTSPELSLDETIAGGSSGPSCGIKALTGKENSSERRAKALRTLKSRIHPDKHPHDKRATYLFQNVQIFYDKCCENLGSSSGSPSSSHASSKKGRKRRQADGPLSEQQHFPLEFDVAAKWPHIELSHPKAPPSAGRTQTNSASRQCISSSTLPALQAFRCLNARGALAHGRRITRHFLWADVANRAELSSVADVFDSVGKGTRELASVEEIKHEIVSRGPVVSVSFRLSQAYLQQIQNARGHADADADSRTDGALCGGFLRDRVDREHELLIVGWGITSFGEVWKVLPLWESARDAAVGDEAAHAEDDRIPPHTLIGIGQFGIDKLCLAPKTNLDHLPWQKGPYFDSDFSDAPKWRTWKEMDLPLTPGEFQMLATCFDKGLIHAANSHLCFVIRDQTHLAHSASYRLKEFRWEDTTGEWITTVILMTDTVPTE